MKNHQKPFALVTGAGQGLGRAYATELACREHNVLLTALPGEGLPDLCASLEKEYAVKADYLECNLTYKTDLMYFINWVWQNYDINVLINNAGIGGTSAFENAQSDFINDMILLNVRAMALLTHRLLPLLRKHQQAWILNVSSMASFSPIGYKTVYPATKAFVLNFSRGLYQELKDSGVFVSVVHPGPMKTNKDTINRIIKQGWRGKIGLISPEEMAGRSLTRLFKRDSLILVGWMNKVNWLLMKTVPIWIRLPLITKLVKREIDGAIKQIHAMGDPDMLSGEHNFTTVFSDKKNLTWTTKRKASNKNYSRLKESRVI